jgi:hypothetical protein
VDASKKIFMTTENLLFGFELFLGGQSDKKLTTQSNCQLFIIREVEK